MTATTRTPGTAGPPASRAAWRRARLPRPGLALAVLFLVLVAVAAVAPDLLAPQDPLAVGADPGFVPAFFSPAHPLGTDQDGRDVFSRLVHGTGPSLSIGLGATGLAVAAGTALGLLAGLGTRWTDGFVMRVLDIVLAIPELLLALVVVALLGTGTANALIAVAVASTPYYARLVRAQTHVVRRSGYVEAATALGVPRAAVIRRHVLPNSIKPMLVLATIRVGVTIAVGASLSFLGLGTKPPAPEWGSMLSTGVQYISIDWMLVAVPGVTITLTVLAITVLGRDLRRRAEGRNTL
jgi:peptide/nickel transport system permease protein